MATFDEQYSALGTGCGVVELAGWSSVTLTGADRLAFLHNFCTGEVNRLTPGENCETFFTNVKGKIVGHGLITCREEELVVIGAPGQGAPLVEHLDRYVIRDDVQLRDTTGERAYALVGGERIADCGLPPASSAEPRTADSPQKSETRNVKFEMRPLNVRCIFWNVLGPRPACLIETVSADLPAIIDALVERGAVVCGREAFETRRIEAGTPLFGVDFDARNFPQEVGRDVEAISFTKGCYLGQETVARIDALGHVNQILVGVRFEGKEVPSVGTELSLSGASVGRVTSAIYSPFLQAPLALAMVRRARAEPDSRLEWKQGTCQVVALPLTK